MTMAANREVGSVSRARVATPTRRPSQKRRKTTRATLHAASRPTGEVKSQGRVAASPFTPSFRSRNLH